MKRKPLTARAAFLLIARAYRSPKYNNGHYWIDLFGRRLMGGVENAMSWIIEQRVLSTAALQTICNLTEEYTPWVDDCYWWSTTTLWGVAEGIYFCRRMADLCKEKPCK